MSKQLSDVSVYSNDQGTMYLTTQVVNSGENTASQSAVSQNGGGQFINSDVVLPTGFAQDFGQMINAVLSLVMMVCILLVFFQLIMGAFNWITSGGDKGKTQKARDRMVASVIGLIIVAASFAVVNVVVRFLGFASINDVLGNIETIN